jgi:hypothetical protein
LALKIYSKDNPYGRTIYMPKKGIYIKSQKGITMMSLVIYVACFLTVTGVVAVITTFFYNNIKIINTDLGSSAYYNKLNLYMANETKKPGNQILKYESTDNRIDESSVPTDVNYITFQDGNGEKNTFLKVGSILYYNKIVLCKNVSEFNISIDESSGNKLIKIYIDIDGIAYSTNYVLGE